MNKQRQLKPWHGLLISLTIGLALVLIAFVGIAWSTGDQTPANGEEHDEPSYADELHQVPISSMNLNNTTKEVEFYYHGPSGTNQYYLEGRVLKQSKDQVTVGVVTIWKQDIVSQLYNQDSKTLFVCFKRSDEIRIAILVFTEFTVPADIKIVRVILHP